jgi:peptidoglycan hydrolase-like protein with peptidoglycan-binding domain
MVNTATTNEPTLKLGSSGAKVRQLQELLNHRLNSNDRVAVDGAFGSKTENAVKIVQFQFFLKQDGVAGPFTWKSLQAKAPINKPVLRRPSAGELIMMVQAVLENGGYYKGAVDGEFGVVMETSIKEFQKAKKLTVDGVIGDNTWDALSDLATLLTID